jgi:hypothetical protein
MAVPWLKVINTVIGLAEIARSRRNRAPSRTGEAEVPLESMERPPGVPPGVPAGLEARLAGVVVAALKETFDRDSRRLELERVQVEAERERTERALRLELLRQAGEREIGRLRLLAGIAVASWISTLFFAARLMGAPVGARVALGGGWLLLLVAIAMSFVAQSQVGAALNRADATADPRDAASSGAAGALGLWLIVLGLALVGLAVLIA